MKVTKQQKVLCAVLVAGALLIGADQLGMLPGSVQASEAPATSEYDVPRQTAAAATPVEASTQPSSGPCLARRLRQAGQSVREGPVRDVFAPGSAWVVPVEVAARTDPAVQAIEQFKQTHRLTGIVSGGGRENAVIDGQIIAVGQPIDGFRLVSLSRRSATFEHGSIRFELTMSERAPAGPTH
jgi:hypothetical protein